MLNGWGIEMEADREKLTPPKRHKRDRRNRATHRLEIYYPGLEKFGRFGWDGIDRGTLDEMKRQYDAKRRHHDAITERTPRYRADLRIVEIETCRVVWPEDQGGETVKPIAEMTPRELNEAIAEELEAKPEGYPQYGISISPVWVYDSIAKVYCPRRNYTSDAVAALGLLERIPENEYILRISRNQFDGWAVDVLVQQDYVCQGWHPDSLTIAICRAFLAWCRWKKENG